MASICLGLNGLKSPNPVLGLLLLTWPNFNPDKDNYTRYTVEIWEWISDFIPNFKLDVITYAYWDLSQTILVKGPLIGAYHFEQRLRHIETYNMQAT